MNKQEIQKAINIVNANKDNPLIKQYYDALYIVLEAYDKSHRNAEKGNFYAFDDKYDYYIIEPTEIIVIENGNYIFKQTGYDAYACDKETNEPRIHFCRSYCNYTLDEIKNVINNYIKEKKNEYLFQNNKLSKN